MPREMTVLSLALLSLFASAQAAGQATTNRDTTTESDTFVYFNDCTQEEVRLAFVYKDNVRITVTPSGRTTRKYSFTTRYSGVGLNTGAHYSGQSVSNANDAFDDGSRGPAVFNIHWRELIVAAGQVPDSFCEFYRRVTIDANGTVTHLDQKVAECTCE